MHRETLARFVHARLQCDEETIHHVLHRRGKIEYIERCGPKKVVRAFENIEDLQEVVLLGAFARMFRPPTSPAAVARPNVHFVRIELVDLEVVSHPFDTKIEHPLGKRWAAQRTRNRQHDFAHYFDLRLAQTTGNCVAYYRCRFLNKSILPHQTRPKEKNRSPRTFCGP